MIVNIVNAVVGIIIKVVSHIRNPYISLLFKYVAFSDDIAVFAIAEVFISH